MANDNDIQPMAGEFSVLYTDICAIIDSTRQQLAAAYTNYQLIMYWSIGTRINRDILGGKRAEPMEQRVKSQACLSYSESRQRKTTVNTERR